MKQPTLLEFLPGYVTANGETVRILSTVPAPDTLAALRQARQCQCPHGPVRIIGIRTRIDTDALRFGDLCSPPMAHEGKPR